MINGQGSQLRTLPPPLGSFSQTEGGERKTRGGGRERACNFSCPPLARPVVGLLSLIYWLFAELERRRRGRGFDKLDANIIIVPCGCCYLAISPLLSGVNLGGKEANWSREVFLSFPTTASQMPNILWFRGGNETVGLVGNNCWE